MMLERSMPRLYGASRGLLEHSAASYTSRLMAEPNPSTVTVVIPVHNEASFLPGALPRLFDELNDVDAEVTVLIAENGSTDGTADHVREAMRDHSNLSLLELLTADYGAAMRDGFLQADSEWVANFDIDYFSGDFLTSALALADSADIVLASKRTEGADDQRSATRRFATWTFNQVLKFALSSGVSDTHGMKLVRRTVVDEIAPRVISTTDLFDTELVVRAERAGYRIVELPVTVEELRDSKSNLLKRVPRRLSNDITNVHHDPDEKGEAKDRCGNPFENRGNGHEASGEADEPDRDAPE
jgi:glycosyltransferase involved in cell wall biosynthesis